MKGEELDRRVGNAEVVRDAFEGMPALVAALEGPEHRMVAANGAYRAFAGRPDFIGKTARQVFPDLAGQQLFAGHAPAGSYRPVRPAHRLSHPRAGSDRLLMLQPHSVVPGAPS